MKCCILLVAVLLDFVKVQLAQVVVIGRTYSKLSDNRCLLQNMSLLSVKVHYDLECSAKCEQSATCGMFMLDNNNGCFLYAAMRPFFYYAISSVMPNTCRIFSTGWAQVSSFS